MSYPSLRGARSNGRLRRGVPSSGPTGLRRDLGELGWDTGEGPQGEEGRGKALEVVTVHDMDREGSVGGRGGE